MKITCAPLSFIMVKSFIIATVLLFISPSWSMMDSGYGMVSGVGNLVDWFSKPNPYGDFYTPDEYNRVSSYVVIYVKNLRTNKYNKKHDFKTDTVVRNCNPFYDYKFEVGFIFEGTQKIKIMVYDEEVSPARLIGRSNEEYSIGQILQNAEQGVRVNLMKLNNENKEVNIPGYLHITAENVEKIHDTITITFTGHGMNPKKLIDPYLIIRKTNNDDSGFLKDVTDIQLCDDLTWKLKILVRKFCNCDLHAYIEIELWQQGREKPSATVSTSFNDLLNINKTFALYPSKRAFLRVEYLRIDDIYPFTSFLQDGLQIQASVVIDFTLSNGDPTEKGSKHYIGKKLNDYEKAIVKVVPIILDLDTDKKVPVYGFGVMHVDNDDRMAFAVNFKPRNPECTELKGVLDAYRNCVNQIELSGLTCFQPSIDRQANYIRQEMVNRSGQLLYFIQLILTDGIIDDLEQTKSAIIDASELPLSIIIVGIGNADFGSMDELDGDGPNGLTDYRQRETLRDIVQFVPFNKHKHDLNQAVLAEIPQQFSSYMKLISFAAENHAFGYPYGVIINRYADAPEQAEQTDNGEEVEPPQDVSWANSDLYLSAPGWINPSWYYNQNNN